DFHLATIRTAYCQVLAQVTVVEVMARQQISNIQGVGTRVTKVHHVIHSRFDGGAFITLVPYKGVITLTTEQDVVAGTTDQGIVSALTVQDVVTVATIKGVIATTLVAINIEVGVVFLDVLVQIITCCWSTAVLHLQEHFQRLQTGAVRQVVWTTTHFMPWQDRTVGVDRVTKDDVVAVTTDDVVITNGGWIVRYRTTLQGCIQVFLGVDDIDLVNLSPILRIAGGQQRYVINVDLEVTAAGTIVHQELEAVLAFAHGLGRDGAGATWTTTFLHNFPVTCLLVVLLQLPLEDVGTVTAAFSIVEAQLAIAARSNGHTWATNGSRGIAIAAVGIRNFQSVIRIPSATLVLDSNCAVTADLVPTVMTAVFKVSHVLGATNNVNNLSTRVVVVAQDIHADVVTNTHGVNLATRRGNQAVVGCLTTRISRSVVTATSTLASTVLGWVTVSQEVRNVFISVAVLVDCRCIASLEPCFSGLEGCFVVGTTHAGVPAGVVAVQGINRIEQIDQIGMSQVLEDHRRISLGTKANNAQVHRAAFMVGQAFSQGRQRSLE